MNDKDLFLLLASLTDAYVNKALIKRLYNSSESFLDLLNNDLSNLKTKITNEEIQKLHEVKNQIKALDLSNIKRALDKKGIQFLALCEKEYPKKLKEINDPPPGLFYKGNLDILNNLKAVAVVGTRAATNYGINISKKVASLLAIQNITIVSGLASGVDASAHIGALKSGKTIAVLGTGVDIIFPASNKELFYEILATGSIIVSEYPPETQGLPWNFPQRNRIISTLSDAVIVIEGNLDSGAMITARFAIKQGKPLFALPGPIDSPMSNGPNVLIKSGVAELLTSVNDILEKIGGGKQMQLGLQDNNEKLEELSEKQKNLFTILSSQSKSFDSIISEINLNVQDLIKELSILELKGFIEKTTDGGYVRLS